MSERENSGHSGDSRPERSFLLSGRLDNTWCAELDSPKSRAIAHQALTVLEQWLRRRAAAAELAKGSRVQPDVKGECFEVEDGVYLEACLLLIKTLIFASRADEHIEQDELGPLCSVYQGLCAQFDAQGFIDKMMTCKVNPLDIAREVRFEEEALDIYLLSSMLLDGPHFLEHNYLEGLGAALHIPPSQQRELDKRARELLHAQSAGA
ncbi:MAG: DUF533 domain-containing protein [Proteobacteria bacterium]|uniref:DUF533 domain-containing protein n=1 Tax=Candidatus Avisuccinivibrio stercorigallinarum TaxID=2840704 RepID=A0A9D9DEQ8_9GAMM|nr:DUF533 domain-containing protein [Candidatus Avisuccinivibrio stercorigallinarum]